MTRLLHWLGLHPRAFDGVDIDAEIQEGPPLTIRQQALETAFVFAAVVVLAATALVVAA